ncbi:MAG: type II toxin-antitoxin system prevent-host-death family antitoxin [Gemmatimonadota bacterium]|jgi:prevent-host-death family protein|nr:type II toxin-antitoxin system prevent-host-death family antitoxin [Gemmatimonadota bacterium]
MIEVGITDLSDQLSRFIRVVRDGQDVLITDRGRPVAKLTGVDTPPALERLIALGVVTPSREPRTPIDVSRLIRTEGSVSDLVGEQRR